MARELTEKEKNVQKNSAKQPNSLKARDIQKNS